MKTKINELCVQIKNNSLVLGVQLQYNTKHLGSLFAFSVINW